MTPPRPPKLARRKSCGTKVKYLSRQAAINGKRRMIEAGSFAPQLSIYACPLAPKGAPHFHVGHARGSAWSK
jgi:hypothetical protein